MIRRPPRSTRTAHSFPTRRSSDLHWGGLGRSARGAGFGSLWRAGGGRRGASGGRHLRDPGLRAQEAARLWLAFRRGSAGCTRSEEHTSELQSLMRISYAVFCLKKKTTHIIIVHLAL